VARGWVGHGGLDRWCVGDPKVVGGEYVNILPANGRKLFNVICQFLLLLQLSTLQLIFTHQQN
jgi:hypothetical protein